MQESQLIFTKKESLFDLKVIPLFIDSDIYKTEAKKEKLLKNFSPNFGKNIIISQHLYWGIGEEEKLTPDKIRIAVAQIFGQFKNTPYEHILIPLDSFITKKLPIETVVASATEGFHLANYQFTKYISEKEKQNKVNQKFYFFTQHLKKKEVLEKISQNSKIVCNNINQCRDLGHEAPNILHSEAMAKFIADDVKKSFKKSHNVSCTVLNKKQIEKEKMELLLAVNKGSAHEARVVKLTYIPPKKSKTQKQIVLVGKGVTYDTGGLCLKPATSMVTMKEDMLGAATVYAAFKSAVLLNSPHKITCLLGITDNALSDRSMLPSDIYISRAGKSVEILNTDAEGRLVLADLLDYACDQNPDLILDAATLTGACVRALGPVCAVMGNNEEFLNRFMAITKETEETSCVLPFFEEYYEDLKGTISDLKNLPNDPTAGAQKAAIFLGHFIKKSIPWIHLDIAGVTNINKAYSPKNVYSGQMVRSITKLLLKETPLN